LNALNSPEIRLLTNAKITSIRKIIPSSELNSIRGLRTSHRYGLKYVTIKPLGAILIREEILPSNSPKLYPDPASFPVQ